MSEAGCMHAPDCVWMCAAGGRGNGHGCFISLSGWSIVASPYVETSNPPTPRRRHKLDPQIPPSRQQRDYGGNGLIYVFWCLPHKPGIGLTLECCKSLYLQFLFFLFPCFVLPVQAKEKSPLQLIWEPLFSLFGILEKERWACKGPPAITNYSPVSKKHPRAALWMIFVLIY